MRAFAVRQLGNTPQIVGLPVPDLAESYLIWVTVAGVNPVDYKMLSRITDKTPFPYVLGADFAGVIERAPEGAGEFKKGDRVFGMARSHGSYCEYTAIEPGKPFAKIPNGVTDEQAAALPIPGVTALGAMKMLEITSNHKVAILGAAGAVGGLAVQIAHAQGAYVIAVVRGEIDTARDLGADEVIDGSSVDIYNAIREAHPDGVDAVLDLFNGPEPIKRDAEILKYGGRLVSAIYAADEQWFSERHIAAQNIVGDTNPVSSPDGLNQLAAMLLDGTITARIKAEVTLEDAPQILDRLKKGGLSGKAIIRL